jgi:hypothetical protein
MEIGGGGLLEKGPVAFLPRSERLGTGYASRRRNFLSKSAARCSSLPSLEGNDRIFDKKMRRFYFHRTVSL